MESGSAEQREAIQHNRRLVSRSAVATAPTIIVIGSSKHGAMPGSRVGSDIFQWNERTTVLLTTNDSNINQALKSIFIESCN